MNSISKLTISMVLAGIAAFSLSGCGDDAAPVEGGGIPIIQSEKLYDTLASYSNLDQYSEDAKLKIIQSICNDVDKKVDDQTVQKNAIDTFTLNSRDALVFLVTAKDYACSTTGDPKLEGVGAGATAKPYAPALTVAPTEAPANK